jgi:hypothetical protein
MTPVTDWTVDYLDGRGPHAVTVPHAWRQEVAVSHEGPAHYASDFEVPKEGGWLLFHGVSYACELSVNDEKIAGHEGIWDAFAVDLHPFAGKSIAIRLAVTKNGGEAFPVNRVASGFLPYVFHTFGGVHGEVEFYAGRTDPLANLPPAPASRLTVDASKLFLDGEPFYMRGLLHWGWYPDLGHTNPDEETIREEVKAAKSLGFNTVKFCLWTPPHRYLDILDEEGMVAWFELPIWNPSDDSQVHRGLAAELEQIVRQYRRHSNIVAWTIGCELGASVPAAFRQRMTSLVRSLTNCPLVKDDSGGAEMYGGDPREYGTFYDFHPYCDLPFYAPVLDGLQPGPRATQPMLLGEFNDYDVHRDLAQLIEDHPFWASALPEYNALGVRWQHDLPVLLRDSRFAHEPRASGHSQLMADSVGKGEFIRQTVSDAVRARDAISGYVVTGWRDTPISSSGMFDDWGKPRYNLSSVLNWNGSAALFLIPQRSPKWVHGGNRPGYLDVCNVWAGKVLWKVGVHSESELTAGGLWRLLGPDGVVAEDVIEPSTLAPLMPHEVGEVFIELPTPGTYTLHVEFGPLRREWPIHVVAEQRVGGRLVASSAFHEVVQNPFGIDLIDLHEFDWSFDVPTVVVLTDAGTSPEPFWRECIFEYQDAAIWDRLRLRNRWERFLPISTDRTLDATWLAGKVPDGGKPLMTRVDTRTYREAPVLVQVADKGFVTTLRPFGGLGSQPPDLSHNPAGAKLLFDLLA